MGAPPTQVIASWTMDGIQSEGWAPIRDVVSRVLTERLPSYSAEEVSDLADASLEHVIRLIRDEIDEAFYDGAVCPVEIDSEEPPYVRNSGASANELLAKLKKVDPFDFEAVCAKILESIGCSSEVTKKTGDGGIDFIATGLDILPTTINCPAYCKATIIGQAKRYSSNLIAEKALREFVGASLLQRHDMRAGGKIVPLTPVLLAFWTTSNFDPSGKKFARRAGVWLMDGRTISSYVRALGLESWVFSLSDLPAQPQP